MARAMRSYRVRPYPGPIVLFRATDCNARRDTKIRADLGWRRVQPSELHVYDLPSGHIDMLKAPHVQTLADRIGQFMHKVES